MIKNPTIRKYIEVMRRDLAECEAKYQGKYAGEPWGGTGNKKTHCINEATLPIMTCDPSCLAKCAGTCYVFAFATIPHPHCRRYEAQNTVLRRLDPKAYYEYFFARAEREQVPLRLSDGGDFENADQVKAAVEAARRHPSVPAIVYTKRLNLLPEFIGRSANLHVRYSGWEGDEAGEAWARKLGFDITHVVHDGSGNCPYQKTLARLNQRKIELAQALLAQGVEPKSVKKQSEKAAEQEVRVWHCRDCAKNGTGCCGCGDISFNVVKGDSWWEQACQAKKAQ